MSFEERHAQVDSDPLIELRRRLELWASAPDSRGQPLMACIVPLSTVRKAVAEIERARALINDMIENDPNDYAADAVTVLDVWRKDARDFIAGTE